MPVSLSSSFLSNLFLGFSHCFSESPAPPHPLGGCRSPSVCFSPCLFFFSLLFLCFSLLRWRLCSPEARRFRFGGLWLDLGRTWCYRHCLRTARRSSCPVPVLMSGSLSDGFFPASVELSSSRRWVKRWSVSLRVLSLLAWRVAVAEVSVQSSSLRFVNLWSISFFFVLFRWSPVETRLVLLRVGLSSLLLWSRGSAWVMVTPRPASVRSCMVLRLCKVVWARRCGVGSLRWFSWAGVGRVSAQWKDINLASGFLTCLVDVSLEEVFSTGLTALMSLGFNGCTRSRVGGSEAAIFGYLLRTTTSSVAEPSSCCRLGSSWVS
ncbi:unnamed protein product [Brassica napus]|uniref:(rape) hypothetical protein n=1 Tax=Brassica napus TaxID=3708 RepID=A0A816LFK5_BRANA|nr:unnamed protein product [Brassica napus]